MSEHGTSGQPEEGQVSETTNLRESDVEKEIQEGEGIPPAEEANQENQTRIEAEITPEETRTQDADDAVDEAVGRDHT